MWPPGGARPRRSGRRSARARAYDQQTLRLFGIPESEIAETLRVAEARGRGLRRARDHDLPAARPRWRWSRAGSRTPSRAWRALRGAGRRAPRALALLHRRLARGRPGGRAAGRALAGAGRVVHRRADGGAGDRAGGLVGLLRRRGRVLLERGEVGAAGRRPGPDRAPRGGLARGGRGDGRRRAGALRGGHRAHRSPAWPVREGAPRPSRSATCAGARSSGDGRALVRDTRLPGDRAEVRDRSTTVGMHLLRRLLRGEELDV